MSELELIATVWMIGIPIFFVLLLRTNTTIEIRRSSFYMAAIMSATVWPILVIMAIFEVIAERRKK